MKYGRPWFGLCNPNFPIFSKPLLDWQHKVITVNLRIDAFVEFWWRFETKRLPPYILNCNYIIYLIKTRKKKKKKKVYIYSHTIRNYRKSLFWKGGKEKEYRELSRYWLKLFLAISNANRLNYRALQKSHIAFKEFRSDSRFRIALRNEELKTPWRASPAPCILFLARGKVISKRSLSIRKLDCVNGHGISSFLEILLPALEMRKKMKWKRKEDLFFSLSLFKAFRGNIQELSFPDD